MVSAWSIGTSQRSFFQKKDTPGPGAYQPFQYHNKTPNSWKIGTEKARQKFGTNKVPGPGQYEPSLSKTQTLRKYPQYVFGVKNYKEHINDTPGPGTYNQNQQKVKQSQPQYTFGLKTGSSLGASKVGQPSPADYNIDRDASIKQRPSSKIGRANRNDLYPTGNPKVGYYNIASKNTGPKYGFGTQSRIQSAQTTYNDNPGPGSYNQKSQLKNNAKTIGSKLTTQNGQSLKDLNSKPGPSDYNVEVNYIKRANPGIKIGRDQRNKITKEESYKPGPNQYRPQSVDKKKPATYKIGSELRGKVLNTDNPGPGTYTLDSSIGKGKKYPMGMKNYIRELEQYPGPADYDQESDIIKSRPQSCKIGSSNRTKFEANQNPGPGTYYPARILKGPEISFGRQERGNTNTIDNPGPGTYKIPPKFADVPQYLISSKKDFYV